MQLNASTIADDFFRVLSNLQQCPTARQKYTVLSSVLHQATDQKLRGVKTAFTSFSAKMQYLLREYNIRENTKDRSLAAAINQARVNIQHCELLSEEDLQASYAHDLKAVSLFLSLIYDSHPIPDDLKESFPLQTEQTFRHRIKNREGRAVASIRCFIDDWDSQFIYATRDDNGESIRVDYTTQSKYSLGDWSYISRLLIKGQQLNLVKPRTEGDTVYAELIVFNPDYLVNVTSIAGCFEEYGASTRFYFFNKLKPNSITQHTLLGALAGQLLDEAAYGKECSYAESVGEFFRHNALALACCEDMDENSFHKNARQQQAYINEVVRHGRIHQKSQATLSSEDLALEPSCFCETLGLQGRMDFLHLDLDTVLEQKSGSAAFPVNPSAIRQQQKHYVQLLLYRAMFHYAYQQVSSDSLVSYLFYSKYENGLLELGNAPRLLFEAMKIRNEIAWSELYFTTHPMKLLEHTQADRLFPQTVGNVLWQRYHKPELERMVATVRNATELERAYYYRFLRFISTEHMLSKVGNHTKENSGFASLWNSSLTEKRQNGNIYEKLQLCQNAQEDINHTTSAELSDPSDRVLQDLQFSFSEIVDADVSNFRLGDIVIFYPYLPTEEPNATQALVFRATITASHPDRLCLRLRNPQHLEVFRYYIRKGCCWAVEHDFMEASYGALYRGLQSLLTANADRRDLILCQRQPQTVSEDVSENLSEFDKMVKRVRQARDLYLIIGPPGTGKTSFGMLNVLQDQLLDGHSSVLLMAYTNRAVDEICSKLVEKDIDFVRLGSDYSCEEAYRDHLFDHRAEACNRVEDIRGLIASTRVFCATTASMNAHLELFRLKQFQLAIIDEASQLLEPNLLGLLCAKHGGENAIRKFVLIGDEKQLPAVVQQEESMSAVSDPLLQSIGLTDCRQSFFERLLRVYGKHDEGRCHLLTHQGRMHPDIAQFPNQAFYAGTLQPVPLTHQREASRQEFEARTPIEQLLCDHRVCFLPCKPDAEMKESDKVNQAEARLIAQVVVAGYNMMLGSFDASKSIGVIVPYRNQISAVRKAIGHICSEQAIEAPLSQITIDTVERYQGSQRDLIVYGFTVSRYYQLAFLTDNQYTDPTDGATIDRKLNVAMTRARRNLVLVGNEELLSHVPIFKQLINQGNSV